MGKDDVRQLGCLVKDCEGAIRRIASAKKLPLEERLDLADLYNLLSHLKDKGLIPITDEPYPVRLSANVPMELITVSEAAEVAGVHKGTITRHTNTGDIEHNGKKGHKRRVSKISVLIWKNRQDERAIRADFREYKKTWTVFRTITDLL